MTISPGTSNVIFLSSYTGGVVLRFAGAVITGISELKPAMNVGDQTELDLLMIAAKSY